ncbi:MAG: plastocyanin/azurin family copper-binding protein [Gemmatimonadota bacterium]|nr:plastocyanin/azurin family copper-binding protein [Gemmatimonadota bacterium]
MNRAMRLPLTLFTLSATFACVSDRSAPTAPGGAELCAAPVAGVIPIRGFAFGSGELRVRAGTRVTWVNCDPESHTATSDDAGWDSGLLAPHAVYTRTFERVGRFAYRCTPHPFMRGVVVVE